MPSGRRRVAGWPCSIRIIPSRSLRGAKRGRRHRGGALRRRQRPLPSLSTQTAELGVRVSPLSSGSTNGDWNAKPHYLLSTTLVWDVSPVFSHSSHRFPRRLRLTSARPPLSKCGEDDDGVELSPCIRPELEFSSGPGESGQLGAPSLKYGGPGAVRRLCLSPRDGIRGSSGRATTREAPRARVTATSSRPSHDRKVIRFFMTCS